MMKAETTQITELRWFAPGPGPVPSATWARHRTDRYHLESLSPDSAVKARGRKARLEVKVLVGHDLPVEVAGTLWSPERWLKSGQFEWSSPQGGDWLSVNKRIWRADGVEVCHVELGGAWWWSLALKIRPTGVSPVSSVLTRHMQRAGASLMCCAYPAWLTSQLPPERSAAAALAAALNPS